MKDLFERAREFRYTGAREELRPLAAGQAPRALFITCSDSRVVPALITGSRPGELFEMRNAGNIVPPYESPTSTGSAATIEYAVEVLEVPDIVVCGHSHCGAVGALARGEDLSGLPDVSGWLEFARPGLAPVLDVPPADPALPRAVQRHVIAQLDTLRGYPTVERRLDEGRLRLHGWFYQVDTGAVWELDPARESFALL